MWEQLIFRQDLDNELLEHLVTRVAGLCGSVWIICCISIDSAAVMRQPDPDPMGRQREPQNEVNWTKRSGHRFKGIILGVIFVILWKT